MAIYKKITELFTFTLSDKDYKEFVKFLDSFSEPNDALKKLLKKDKNDSLRS